MKLFASEKRLNKCLGKHVGDPAEPWGRVLNQTAAEVRRAFRSGDGLAEAAPSVRRVLKEKLSEQLSLSEQRPIYASYIQQQVDSDGNRIGRAQPALHFVTPSKMCVICERIDDDKCRLITAYFPKNAKSWKDTAARLLVRYCKDKRGSYRIPSEPKKVRQRFDGIEREVEVDKVQLHAPKQFGVRQSRGTRVDRWNPPRWPEADHYDSGTESPAKCVVYRFDPKIAEQPLKGGLER